jgi:hypothetical protein
VHQIARPGAGDLVGDTVGAENGELGFGKIHGSDGGQAR